MQSFFSEHRLIHQYAGGPEAHDAGGEQVHDAMYQFDLATAERVNAAINMRVQQTGKQIEHAAHEVLSAEMQMMLIIWSRLNMSRRPAAMIASYKANWINHCNRTLNLIPALRQYQIVVTGTFPMDRPELRVRAGTFSPERSGEQPSADPERERVMKALLDPSGPNRPIGAPEQSRFTNYFAETNKALGDPTRTYTPEQREIAQKMEKELSEIPPALQRGLIAMLENVPPHDRPLVLSAMGKLGRIDPSRRRQFFERFEPFAQGERQNAVKIRKEMMQELHAMDISQEEMDSLIRNRDAMRTGLQTFAKSVIDHMEGSTKAGQQTAKKMGVLGNRAPLPEALNKTGQISRKEAIERMERELQPGDILLTSQNASPTTLGGKAHNIFERTTQALQGGNFHGSHVLFVDSERQLRHINISRSQQRGTVSQIFDTNPYTSVSVVRIPNPAQAKQFIQNAEKFSTQRLKYNSEGLVKRGIELARKSIGGVTEISPTYTGNSCVCVDYVTESARSIPGLEQLARATTPAEIAMAPCVTPQWTITFPPR